MTYATYARSHIRLANDRISLEDAARQERAASEVLSRLHRQPGVVLADEVGMGKTFVAMAVAVSILIERPDEGPVVVMCPSSLKQKWPKDWDVFRKMCLAGSLGSRFRAASAESGIAFLRLLDDPPERRAHIVFLTHGAVHRAIGDGFAKLAVIKRAFKGRSSLRAQREAFTRFAGKLLGLDWVERRSEGILGRLMDRPYDAWLKVLHRESDHLKAEFADDPVPQHLADVLGDMESTDLDDLVESLRGLPLRESANLDDRLRDARRGIALAMDQIWRLALTKANFRSPLLVLDEAHHVKNPATRLASLFATEDSVKDSEFFTSAGPLGAKFDRMLFLTATPFQLGHGELIRVLERFEGIAWSGRTAPEMSKDQFKRELLALGEVLDDAQASALRLDGAWGRLGSEHVVAPDGTAIDVDSWWEDARQTEGDGLVAQVAAQVRGTRQAMEAAEAALSPWVLRHLKASQLPGAPGVQRRLTLTGAAIRDNGDPSCGLEVTGPVLLPFLLAGRAQGLLAASTRGRALFAEGLASSFEAYLETRGGRAEVDEEEAPAGDQDPPELEWYLRHLDMALPRESQDARSAHPKIKATAEKAVALWRAGEKVLIFCHYRATGRALRQHISSLLNEEIGRLGQAKMPKRSIAEVHVALEELGERFFKDDGLRMLVSGWIDDIVAGFPAITVDHRNKIVDVVRRFLRTPSFIARYLPMEDGDLSAAAFARAFDAADEGQQSLRHKIEYFCRFLAERCIDSERDGFLAALDSIQTGSHVGKEVRALFDQGEDRAHDEVTTVLLPNVRLANGEVRQETRQRLLLTFNTPLFPEVLIASSVLAEGVDLHLNCRYVIHHDLCWNPSTLEQRSGRVDRIGSQAERVKKSIHLYLPYLAATQDEKMYRVVRDRERWFQIVMGENYEVDEAATDRREERIPLPAQVHRELSMRLHSHFSAAIGTHAK